MTIAELLGRIVLAFVRSLNLVAEGKFSDLLLSDLGIIVATVFASLIALGVLLAIIIEALR